MKPIEELLRIQGGGPFLINSFLVRKVLCALWWLLPSAFALYIYQDGLLAWFQQDDFVWLSLLSSVHDAKDLAVVLFTPAQHGTWRPLSERAYFLTFQALFGYNAVPYHVWSFLTQCANLVLLASITTRLTGSRMAGLLAPILWTASSKLFVMMVWSSEYILVLCAFFLLLAFHFLLRYAETGQPRFWRYCWAAYLAGFLAMESNIVFPLVAASYTYLYARKIFRKSLLLFVPTAIYGALHVLFAPRGTGAYAMHFTGAILRTLAIYWTRAFEHQNFTQFTPFPAWVEPAGVVAFTVALLGFVVWQAVRRNWLPAMLLAWFVLLLAPVLPLRDHVTDYYLSLPMIALSMLGATAFAGAWRANPGAKVLAIALGVFYLAESAPVAKGGTKWWSGRSHEVEQLVRFVFRAHEQAPAKVIVLEGIDSLLFWTAMAHRPFLDDGGMYAYVSPAAAEHIELHTEAGIPLANFIYPADRLAEGLATGQVVLFDVSGPPYRDITSERRQSAAASPGVWFLDAASPAHARWLGPEWYSLEAGHRWMPKRATVWLAGPPTSVEKLRLHGYCSALLLAAGPVTLSALVDGRRTAPATLKGESFDVSFDLPQASIGKARLRIEIEVSRTFRAPPDQRDLGVAFGSIEIR